MDLFPRTFLLVFFQLCVGGFFSLSIPPFHEVDRGYYKSSARDLSLVRHPRVDRPPGAVEWQARTARRRRSARGRPVGSGRRHGHGLPVDPLVGARRAAGPTLRRHAACSACSALIAVGRVVRAGGVRHLRARLSALSFLLSALLLGAASAGMLLGHWYLIDRDLSLDPFEPDSALLRRLPDRAIARADGRLASAVGGRRRRKACVLSARWPPITGCYSRRASP